MIIDQLKNAVFYSGLHQGLDTAFHYLQNTELANLEPGRREIDGANVYVNVVEYNTRPKEDAGRWEAHREYMDVQYVAEGVELMGYAPLDQLETGEYNEERDILAVSGKIDFFVAPEGTFAIFGPQDGHTAALAVAGPEHVRKIVVKVRVAGK